MPDSSGTGLLKYRYKLVGGYDQTLDQAKLRLLSDQASTRGSKVVFKSFVVDASRNLVSTDLVYDLFGQSGTTSCTASGC